MDHIENQARSGSGHCLFVIAAPSDPAIYECFRSLARRWFGSLSAERLWIERDVPLSSGFTSEHPPDSLARLLTANVDVIARIEMEFGDIAVRYARTGGHGPTMYRESLFDEVRLETRDCDLSTTLSIAEMVDELHIHLDIVAAMISEGLDKISTHLNVPHLTTVYGAVSF